MFFSDNYLSAASIMMDTILVGGCVIAYFLPRRFGRTVTVLGFMWGVFVVTICDYTIGGHILNFYDSFSSPKYTLMDLIKYLSYAPISFLFIYIYDCFRIHGWKTSAYVLAWSILGVASEWLAVKLNVYEYFLGYSLAFSFPIYLLIQSVSILLFNWLRKD
jgi:hypothetical protein